MADWRSIAKSEGLGAPAAPAKASGGSWRDIAKTEQLVVNPEAEADRSFYNSIPGQMLRGGKDVLDYGAEKLAGVFSSSEGARVAAMNKEGDDYYNSLADGDGSSVGRTVGQVVTAAAPVIVAAPEAVLAGATALGRGALTAGRAAAPHALSAGRWLFTQLANVGKAVGRQIPAATASAAGGAIGADYVLGEGKIMKKVGELLE